MTILKILIISFFVLATIEGCGYKGDPVYEKKVD